MKYFWILIFAFLIPDPASGQDSLTLDQIMKGQDYTGYWPDNIRWSDDGQEIYFTWNPGLKTLPSLYKISLPDLVPREVLPEEEKSLPADGDYTRDFSKKVYEKYGDLFLFDCISEKTTRITNTVTAERHPLFTQNGRNIVYQAGFNLFSLSLSGGTLVQLTNFLPGTKAEKHALSTQDKWLEEEQMSLFQVMRDRKFKHDLNKSRSDSIQFKRPREIYLEGKTLRNLLSSPDERYITFSLSTTDPAEEVNQIADYITESSYTESLNSRPYVGTSNPAIEFGIYDRTRDTLYYIDVRTIPGIYDKPGFLRDYASRDSLFKPVYEKPRIVDLAGPIYNDDGSLAVTVIRSADHKDRWIMTLDLSSGKLKLLDHQHDEAWIGGPGIGDWEYSRGNIGWLGDNRTLWFQSEVSGYSHLYSLDINNGKKHFLTSGHFEVDDARLSRSKKYFYLQAGAENPFEYHYYRLPVTGGKLEKITSMPGRNEAYLSPNEQFIAVLYSYSNRIPELYLMENKPGARMQQLTHSATKAFLSYPWRDPEIVFFKARDGVQVPARLYKPSRNPSQKPGVIFVHGAGYLHNVHKWWSEYYREYMFNNFLCDRGYMVLDIDYRGSAGYGRDWRTAIYRHMGGTDLTDQADGAEYLIRDQQVDSTRIGIYGGSYGGFITLFALFKYPDLYRCGAALRAVSDWSHYNQGYTSNILNTPAEDSIAYHESSPIFYAEGLKGELLMFHGVVDSNVLFQDAVRLTQRLIELGKTNWNLAIYPVESHGFTESSSWADEYKRIFDLFERNLK